MVTIPAVDVLYFRLKMADIDDRFTYSPVVALRKNKLAETFTILNNPVLNTLHISVLDAGLKNTLASILNLHGALVKNIHLYDDIEAIDISHLPAGTYILQTEKGNKPFLVIK